MKRIAFGVAMLAAIVVAIVMLLFPRHREPATGLVTPRASSIAAPARLTPASSANPQPSGSVHFLPELPPRDLAPRKPSIFQAPAKAGTGNPS